MTLSWPAVAGATSYNVYGQVGPGVTIGGAQLKTTVSSPSATLSSLFDDLPFYAAVTAVNAGGESPLSSEVCAVPTTSGTAGLTLYDTLCAPALDGQKWQTPLFSRSVANGAMLLSAQASNAESRTVKFLSYQTLTTVNTTSRVTTLTADVAVPSASAARMGTAEIRAMLRLTYQPPANRLNFPGGSMNQLLIEVGLIDNGNGLRAARVFRHCDSADCLSRSISGIAFVDPSGFTTTSSGQTEAPAAYDTIYTVSVSLDETTGVLSWSFDGGVFTNATGTADPTAYLAASSDWAGVPLAGSGFSSAQLAARVFDDSSAGGSSGNITGRFANVNVGLNNAVASLYDNFSTFGSVNGQLSLAKWTNAGSNSTFLDGGALLGDISATSENANGFASAQAMTLDSSATNNTLQSDVKIATCTSTVVSPAVSNRVQLQGNFYNDGSAGTTSPDINQANSAVGDVRAILELDCASNQASLAIIRFNNAAGTSGTTLTVSPNPVVAKGPSAVTGNKHTLMLKWDPASHTFTFQVDGQTPTVVDPTVTGALIATAAPVAGPPNSPLKQLAWVTSVPSGSAAGSFSRMIFTVNNVFTAP
jgi:hypothetical protein